MLTSKNGKPLYNMHFNHVHDARKHIKSYKVVCKHNIKNRVCNVRSCCFDIITDVETHSVTVVGEVCMCLAMNDKVFSKIVNVYNNYKEIQFMKRMQRDADERSVCSHDAITANMQLEMIRDGFDFWCCNSYLDGRSDVKIRKLYKCDGSHRYYFINYWVEFVVDAFALESNKSNEDVLLRMQSSNESIAESVKYTYVDAIRDAVLRCKEYTTKKIKMDVVPVHEYDESMFSAYEHRCEIVKYKVPLALSCSEDYLIVEAQYPIHGAFDIKRDYYEDYMHKFNSMHFMVICFNADSNDDVQELLDCAKDVVNNYSTLPVCVMKNKDGTDCISDRTEFARDEYGRLFQYMVSESNTNRFAMRVDLNGAWRDKRIMEEICDDIGYYICDDVLQNMYNIVLHITQHIKANYDNNK